MILVKHLFDNMLKYILMFSYSTWVFVVWEMEIHTTKVGCRTKGFYAPMAFFFSFIGATRFEESSGNYEAVMVEKKGFAGGSFK